MNVSIASHGGVGFGSGPRATGGPTYPGSVHEVVEQGRSELLHENGKTFLLSGANGRVEPLPFGATNGGTTGGWGVRDVHIHQSTTSIADLAHVFTMLRLSR
jgi:hypothetical protein